MANLGLNYAPDVPLTLQEIMEHHARRLGVSLAALDRIASELATVENFIVACESGIGMDFARAVEYGEAPETIRAPPLVMYRPPSATVY